MCPGIEKPNRGLLASAAADPNQTNTDIEAINSTGLTGQRPNLQHPNVGRLAEATLPNPIGGSVPILQSKWRIAPSEILREPKELS
ncbi:MAG: hypothetical protein HOL92_00215 [Opitutales bacterium]|nr:hypothetical protein [Opitutales bacterium]